MVLTGQVPDLVIVDRSTKPVKVMLVELKVPCDAASSFKEACDRKTARYSRLKEDLRLEGYSPFNLPLEIWCRGLVNTRNMGVLATICYMVGIRCLKRLQANLFFSIVLFSTLKALQAYTFLLLK